VFNGNIPNQYSLPSRTSLYYLKLWPHSKQMAQHISWSQGYSTSSHNSKPILWTFTLVWTVPDNFLYYRILEFMFALQIVAIKLLTLKHLLINSLALEPLCESQMVMSNFGDILIILGLEVSEILLKMWLFLRIFSTTSKFSGTFVFSMR